MFPVSLVVSLVLDMGKKFDLKEENWEYNIALLGYCYFCFYLAIILTKKIIKIVNRASKILIYVFCWIIPLIFFVNLDKLPQTGFWSTAAFLVFTIILLLALFLTFYNLYKIRKIILSVLAVMMFVSSAIWLIWNKFDEKKVVEEKNKKETSDSGFLIQPWQLNSRYKINNVVKFLKVDLDKDEKDELAAITSYDKVDNEVFYYAGFYRYNPVTEMWDEYYSEDLNILNYGMTDTSKIENMSEFKDKFIKIWSEEFTTLKNIGDITGDGCPEIVFSSLLQGKYFDNYIILAQSGESHYRFKIFTDQNTMAEIVSEDGMLIEKYFEGDYSLKKIYEWNDENLGFKLIETQKKKIPAEELPKVSPEIEGLTS